MDDASLEFAEPTIDPAVARAERRLRLLEEVTEIGMELIRSLRPGAETAPGVSADEMAAAPRREPADLYASLSRAIRLTIALETKTDKVIAELKAGPVRERPRKIAGKRDQDETEDEVVTDPILVWMAVTRIIMDEAESPDRERELKAAMNEHLDHDEAYQGIDMRPLGETVERLCRDLGLQPDWSRVANKPGMEGWKFGAAPSSDGHTDLRPSDPSAVPPPADALIDADGRPRHDLE